MSWEPRIKRVEHSTGALRYCFTRRKSAFYSSVHRRDAHPCWPATRSLAHLGLLLACLAAWQRRCSPAGAAGAAQPRSSHQQAGVRRPSPPLALFCAGGGALILRLRESPCAAAQTSRCRGSPAHRRCGDSERRRRRRRPAGPRPGRYRPAGLLSPGRQRPLSRQAEEQERFATRSLEFIYRTCASLAGHGGSAGALRAMLEDLADSLDARACALALLEPVADGLGVPGRSARRASPRCSTVRPEMLARAAASVARPASPDGEVVGWPCRWATPTDLRRAGGGGPRQLLLRAATAGWVDAVAAAGPVAGQPAAQPAAPPPALMDERSAIAGELHDSCPGRSHCT